MTHVDRQQAVHVAQLPVGRPRLEETLVQRVLPLSGRHRQEERRLPPNMVLDYKRMLLYAHVA